MSPQFGIRPIIGKKQESLDLADRDRPMLCHSTTFRINDRFGAKCCGFNMKDITI
jgi:hypothetical protein